MWRSVTNRKPQPFFLQTRGHRPPSSDLTDTRPPSSPKAELRPPPASAVPMPITRPDLNLANVAKQLSTPAPVNPCRARPENWTQPPGLHPSKRTNTRTTGGRARRFLVCGRRIRLDRRADPGTSPAHSPAFHRPSPDRPPSAQHCLPSPAERSGPLNLRRVGQRSGKGVGADRTAVPPPVLSTSSRPHTAPSLAPPALLRRCPPVCRDLGNSPQASSPSASTDVPPTQPKAFARCCAA